MAEQSTGTLWGISAGPGDPELLTLKAARLLQTCPVVAFPAGRQGQPGVAQKIIQPLLAPEQVQLPLTFPFVQDAAVLTAAWSQAAQAVWSYLKTGQDVVFATEGDASFYSTFTYLAQTLQQHHPEAKVATVPGVCSPLAAAAQLGLPLTILQQRLLVLPALYAIADLETALDQADVVVLMKVASVYAEAWQILQRRDLLAHSRVIVRATQIDEQIYTDLSDRPHLDLPYFSLMMINCDRSSSALPATQRPDFRLG
ncbi:precorrin-2 C(20)-methyltransferase [Leptolyngbya iicbica]|uniref:Precorrin-2 C(20)-methyltransferase n=2 Tax=Cyanophyceae TaxID=3028117 RepID=A0A4Q7EFA4_9CYAN|nr:precorrin-2 C(20)-methyltransferase [Leptolyngbya sp. LK]RZM81955.1 precorrin-2 C(20)-methyltransferase [Leptolyngbya sp. LK]